MYVVVPAGGSGTRLWPLSRAAQPKFFHDLSGTGRSLLQATYARLAPLAGGARTYVVTGAAHAAGVARQLPELPAENVLVEPAPRDSAPAIGLAAAIIARRDGDAVMGSFASDHLVGNEAGFRATVETAVRVAAGGYLTAIGIRPSAPETGYGYVRRGERLGEGGAYLAAEFKEKPPADVAAEYFATGQYLWNASMFVWPVSVFLEELSSQQPLLYDGLSRIADAWGTPGQDESLSTIWPTLPRLSVDHAVMEGAATRERVAVVPGDFGWHDIGDWDTLGSVVAGSPDGNVVIGAPADFLGIDTDRTVVVPRSGRLVATLGVTGLVVVDTDDAVLVCPRHRAQDVRLLVAALQTQGRDGLV